MIFASIYQSSWVSVQQLVSIVFGHDKAILPYFNSCFHLGLFITQTWRRGSRFFEMVEECIELPP